MADPDVDGVDEGLADAVCEDDKVWEAVPVDDAVPVALIEPDTDWLADPEDESVADGVSD